MFASLLNPVKWIKAFFYQKQTSKYVKSNNDLELLFYSKALEKDMLHFGWFEEPGIRPETISLKQVEDAQVNYAEHLIEHIEQKKAPVLDVGCGMGGLTDILLEKGFEVEPLTPNNNQIDYIRTKHPDLKIHHCRYGRFETTNKYGTVINSESLQYISLPKAFDKTKHVLLPNGSWIITDFFRTEEDGRNSSSHLLEEFLVQVKKNNWEIIYQQDITANILPTLTLAHMYATRFLLPAIDLAYEKLRYKKSWLYYMTQELRDSGSKKIDKELAAIDPEKFVAEKKYLLFVLKNNGNK